MIEALFSSRYLAEFLAMAVAHAVAVASPGPDFAVVSRYSVRYGARIAVWVSLGIALGILIHVTYSVLGLAIIIATTPWLYSLLLLTAACYFFYLGFSALRSRPGEQTSEHGKKSALAVASMSTKRAVGIGFLTNGLNIKATMFFLALFTSIISPATPIVIKAGYGVYLAIATFAWFATLSLLLGKTRIRELLLAKGYWFDRVMGAILWILAANLLFQWWKLA
ncbi:LysE family translocator [Aliidiomarina halalkaliphila]|uniref:LysE family translocator n=1 Tax=Aliidiomarina halalkaliphila TaxID=2593535 RepID=A0A552X3V0_9GAMM|nr:LysE family transporter [Aliidiomarina halalkaliphila]TRW49710.1 LysE family translocator [Aliidiomarina halalkaliphila]